MSYFFCVDWKCEVFSSKLSRVLNVYVQYSDYIFYVNLTLLPDIFSVSVILVVDNFLMKFSIWVRVLNVTELLCGQIKILQYIDLYIMNYVYPLCHVFTKQICFVLKLLSIYVYITLNDIYFWGYRNCSLYKICL
jgi:hypothetical protein